MSYSKDKTVLGGPGRLIRFSFAEVLKPTHNDEKDKDEYSVMFLIPKSDKETLNAINRAVEAFKKEVYGNKIPGNLFNPLQDGDEYYSSTTGEQDKNRLGCYYMSAKTCFPPQVKKLVGKKMVDAKTEDDFYSGCYGIASVNFFDWANMGKRGISAGLSSVCKIKDGERLGGSRADAEKEFAALNFDEFAADQDDFDEADTLEIDDDDLPF